MSLNLCFLGTDIRMKFTFIIVISYYVSQFCTWLGGSFVSHGANWGPGIAGKSKMASLIWPEVGTDHELGAQLELPARNLGPPPCICPHGCLCFLVAWRWGASQEVKTEARGTEITQNHLHQILFILPDVRVRPKDSGRRQTSSTSRRTPHRKAWEIRDSFTATLEIQCPKNELPQCSIHWRASTKLVSFVHSFYI